MKIKVGIGFSIFILFFTSKAWADNFTGTPTSYRVTVNRIEFYNNTTGSWVLVGEGDMTFDIASVGAGQAVGNYASGAIIPEGTYTQVRVKVSRTMQIQGSASHGGTTYYTTTTQQDIVTGGKAVIADTTSPAELGTMVVPTDNLPSGMSVDGGYFIITETLSSPFTVTRGSVKVSIDFDVTDKITFNHDNPTVVCWPTAPTTTFSVD